MYRVVWYEPTKSWEIERAGTGEFDSFSDALAEVYRRMAEADPTPARKNQAEAYELQAHYDKARKKK